MRIVARGHFAFRRKRGREGQERYERAFCHTVAREEERIWRAVRGHIALRCGRGGVNEYMSGFGVF